MAWKQEIEKDGTKHPHTHAPASANGLCMVYSCQESICFQYGALLTLESHIARCIQPNTWQQ
jgi:hypothetical protein